MGFGVWEVFQWRDLQILLQMDFGRACDDHRGPTTDTGTISASLSELAIAKSDIGLLESRDLSLIKTQDLALFDGSGLSPRNRVSPVTIADVLTDVAAERRWTELAQGLAVAGVTGTLANRFTTKATSSGRGVVRAKTGTLTGVAALAGIVIDADKRPLVFAIIGNNITSQARARDTMDRIASQLAKCGCSS